jgi:hypothetical protein
MPLLGERVGEVDLPVVSDEIKMSDAVGAMKSAGRSGLVVQFSGGKEEVLKARDVLEALRTRGNITFGQARAEGWRQTGANQVCNR